MPESNPILILGISIFVIGFVIKKVFFRGSKLGPDKDMTKFEILEIQMSKSEEAPREAQGASMSMENLVNALHGLLKEDSTIQEHFSFELTSSGEHGMRFYAAVPSNILKFVESQIYAQYPTAKIRVVPDYTSRLDPTKTNYEISTIKFARPYYFPIKSFRDFEVDPLSSITSALSQPGVSDDVWFQVILEPIPDKWQPEGYAYTKSVRDGSAAANSGAWTSVFNLLRRELLEIIFNIVVGLFTAPKPREDLKKSDIKAPPKLSASQELELRSIENKMSRMGFRVILRIMSSSDDLTTVETHSRSVIASLKQFSAANLNSFVASVEKDKPRALNRYIKRTMEPAKALILNTEEIASVFHLPNANIETPTISWVFSKNSEPPADIPTEDCTFIGETMYRNKKITFGINNSNDDRLRHMYMIGKSGTGKSTLMYSMICQDINNGEGVAVLDPHGETIENILERIPDNRIDDVVYFDPSDVDNPIGLNLLEMDDPAQKNLMASGLVSAIKQHFDYSWGPRLEYLLNYAMLTLLDVPGTTMLGITRLMEDQNYQKYILHQVKDPVVQKFWESEFKEMKGNQKLVTEAISPIQNKVNRFLASTVMRNILGQKRSTLDLWDIMNSGKILLINLSKGKIGSDNANLLGALLVSRLQFFALQRAKIPYQQRKPFYMYVDEFQNFASGSFEEILSESRKYKLGLYLTHQFTAQLPEQLLKAVYGNVGTILTFSLGAPDARELEREFAPYFTFEDILSLERFQVYIKLMINGMTSHPFSARILVPWVDKFLDERVPKTGNKEKVIAASRAKYGVDRKYVEEKINKWVETKFDKGMAIAQEYSRLNSAKEAENAKLQIHDRREQEL